MRNEQITNLSHTSLKSIHKTKNRSKMTQKIITWSIITLFVAFLVFLNFWFQGLYLELYEITKKIIDEATPITYFKILLLNALLQMCFVPGISFFMMFIGFICKNYLYALSLVYPSTLIICALTYFATRFTIKGYLERKLSRKWYFKMFYQESGKQPWKTSFMMRFILIPVTYKNYLISLMEINFVQFIVPAVFFYLPYFSSYILIGMTLSSIQEIISGKISQAEKNALIVYITVYVILIVLSLVFCGILIKKTCELRNKYKEESRREELLSIQRDVN